MTSTSRWLHCKKRKFTFSFFVFISDFRCLISALPQRISIDSAADIQVQRAHENLTQ